MKILALDAATEACSAALYHDGEVEQRYVVAPREHARLLLPMTQALLDCAGWRLQQLDAIAFGRGPGAFTGLRIAAGITQGLAFAADLPVVAVSDLAALAAGATRACGAQRILALADARMGEVYWCPFDATGADQAPIALAEERVQAPGLVQLEDDGSAWMPAGNGWRAYPTELQTLAARLAGAPVIVHPAAEDIARLAVSKLNRGELLAPEQALPCYVRDQVARKPGQQPESRC